MSMPISISMSIVNLACRRQKCFYWCKKVAYNAATYVRAMRNMKWRCKLKKNDQNRSLCSNIVGLFSDAA